VEMIELETSANCRPLIRFADYLAFLERHT
jgi:hypothetical protein